MMSSTTAGSLSAQVQQQQGKASLKVPRRSGTTSRVTIVDAISHAVQRCVFLQQPPGRRDIQNFWPRCHIKIGVESMGIYGELKNRRRDEYSYMLEYRTRWSDNDMYDHMNNSVYNFLYDSVVNTYLIEECGLQPPSSHQYGLVVHSHSDFFGSISFPAVAELALRVNKLGKSSVTYELALFQRGVDKVKAVGQITHVFVDRNTGRPATKGMNDDLKAGLQKIVIQQPKL